MISYCLHTVKGSKVQLISTQVSFWCLDDALLNDPINEEETGWDENNTLLGAAKGKCNLILKGTCGVLFLLHSGSKTPLRPGQTPDLRTHL